MNIVLAVLALTTLVSANTEYTIGDLLVDIIDVLSFNLLDLTAASTTLFYLLGIIVIILILKKVLKL